MYVGGKAGSNVVSSRTLRLLEYVMRSTSIVSYRARHRPALREVLPAVKSSCRLARRPEMACDSRGVSIPRCMTKRSSNARDEQGVRPIKVSGRLSGTIPWTPQTCWKMLERWSILSLWELLKK